MWSIVQISSCLFSFQWYFQLFRSGKKIIAKEHYFQAGISADYTSNRPPLECMKPPKDDSKKTLLEYQTNDCFDPFNKFLSLQMTFCPCIWTSGTLSVILHDDWWIFRQKLVNSPKVPIVVTIGKLSIGSSCVPCLDVMRTCYTTPVISVSAFETCSNRSTDFFVSERISMVSLVVTDGLNEVEF